MTGQPLGSLRCKIDELDAKIIGLLNERASVSISIGAAKSSGGNIGPIHVPKREQQVYDRVVQLNQGPLPAQAIQAVYREIMSASIALQRETLVAYLGPRGSYSYQCALGKFGEGVSLVSCDTIPDVFDAVQSTRVSYGLVPFENSSFGSVDSTLDAFKSFDVVVRGEVFLPVHHCLLSKSSGFTKIYSHEQAFGQCSTYLDTHYPNIERIRTSSTSKAAELASNDPYGAAIANAVCGPLYNLSIIQESIQNLKNNTTRFFILGTTLDEPSGSDCTLIKFTIDHRVPGSLCDALSVFKACSINLSKIDSRPLLTTQWHYLFFVEFEGHVRDLNVVKALESLSSHCLEVSVLGSYYSNRKSS